MAPSRQGIGELLLARILALSLVWSVFLPCLYWTDHRHRVLHGDAIAKKLRTRNYLRFDIVVKR